MAAIRGTIEIIRAVADRDARSAEIQVRLKTDQRSGGEMNTVRDRLEDEVMRLSRSERAELAQRIIDSLEPEPLQEFQGSEQAWTEELARRVAEIDAGTADLVSYEEFVASAKARYG